MGRSGPDLVVATGTSVGAERVAPQQPQQLRGLPEFAGVEADLVGRDEGVEGAGHESQFRVGRQRRARDGLGVAVRPCVAVAIRRCDRLRLRDLAIGAVVELHVLDVDLVPLPDFEF
jgi:hypothetical protein